MAAQNTQKDTSFPPSIVGGSGKRPDATYTRCSDRRLNFTGKLRIGLEYRVGRFSESFVRARRDFEGENFRCEGGFVWEILLSNYNVFWTGGLAYVC